QHAVRADLVPGQPRRTDRFRQVRRRRIHVRQKSGSRRPASIAGRRPPGENRKTTVWQPAGATVPRGPRPPGRALCLDRTASCVVAGGVSLALCPQQRWTSAVTSDRILIAAVGPLAPPPRV